MNRTVSWIVGILAVVAILVLAMMGSQGKLGNKKVYQAVFLSNGQVYFGKVSGERSSTVTVRDIYYLRVQKAVQPADNTAPDQQSQVQLIKLGNELHGPKDEMRINHDQILFIEDLKDDGRVVKAIHDFQAKGGNTASPAASPSASPSK